MTFAGLFKRFLWSTLNSAENFVEKHRNTTLLDATIKRGQTTMSIQLQSSGQHPDVTLQTVFTLNGPDMLCIIHLTDEELVSFANSVNAIVELKAKHTRFAAAARSQKQSDQQ